MCLQPRGRRSSLPNALRPAKRMSGCAKLPTICRQYSRSDTVHTAPSVMVDGPLLDGPPIDAEPGGDSAGSDMISNTR